MKQKIGFLGLGIMGSAMAANLHRAGYPLLVYNRTPEKCEPLAAQGAGVASDPRHLAQVSDVIIAMVTGPEALEQLLFGPKGAASAFNEKKVFINMSSVPPRYTRELAARLAPTAATFIDAPVSGTKKPAEEGALVILAGGREEAVTGLEPIFLTLGKKVVYCGEVGQGSMMKMFINLLLGVMMAGFAECLNFGRLGGLDLEAMLDTVFSGAMNSPMFQVKAANLREKNYPPAFPLKHLAKDAKFVVDTAYETGAPTPLGQMLLHLYRLGVARGWGDEDISAIARVMEHLSGK
ncbi:MAG: NAD(P)-dependent oxidoreductase [Deltaproteobacteria bacterium]|nr:MAG: NAD(P)-dependent oxidoreductase [Deltaproteobacteria bacterium]